VAVLLQLLLRQRGGASSSTISTDGSVEWLYRLYRLNRWLCALQAPTNVLQAGCCGDTCVSSRQPVGTRGVCLAARHLRTASSLCVWSFKHVVM
jgi:hypothetical protein